MIACLSFLRRVNYIMHLAKLQGANPFEPMVPFEFFPPVLFWVVGSLSMIVFFSNKIPFRYIPSGLAFFFFAFQFDLLG